MAQTTLSRREALGVMAAAPLLAKDEARAQFPVHPDRRPALQRAGLRWASLRQDAEHRPHRARRGHLRKRVRDHAALCSPSRASFLTGRYVRSHKVLDNTDHNELSHQLITWPRLLHDAGYETGYAGKWHMGTDDTPRPGFDRWVSFKGQGVYNDPLLNIDGKRTQGQGLHHRRAHGLRRRLPEEAAHQTLRACTWRTRPCTDRSLPPSGTRTLFAERDHHAHAQRAGQSGTASRRCSGIVDGQPPGRASARATS